MRFTSAPRSAIFQSSFSHLSAISQPSRRHLGANRAPFGIISKPIPFDKTQYSVAFQRLEGSGDPVFCRMELAGLAFHPIKHNTLWPPRGSKVLGTLCFIEWNWPACVSCNKTEYSEACQRPPEAPRFWGPYVLSNGIGRPCISSHKTQYSEASQKP